MIAAPVMSRFCSSIAAGPLRLSPPESKVIPLPTNATWPFDARRRMIAQLDKARLARTGLRHSEQRSHLEPLNPAPIAESRSSARFPWRSADARSARNSGVASSAGVLIRSRAKLVAAAIRRPSSIARDSSAEAPGSTIAIRKATSGVRWRLLYTVGTGMRSARLPRRSRISAGHSASAPLWRLSARGGC